MGPVWRGGGQGEEALLASCYRSSLAEADRVGARTLAFPAISTGIYGFPSARAAEIAVTTLRDTPTGVERVTLVAFDARTARLYARLLEDGTG